MMHTPEKLIFQWSHLKIKREEEDMWSDVDDECGVPDYDISQPRI